jgi:hypothetical protein
MKKFFSLVMGVFFAMVLVSNVQAQNPHLTYQGPSTVSPDGKSVSVSIQLSGLGNSAVTIYGEMDMSVDVYCTTKKKANPTSAGGCTFTDVTSAPVIITPRKGTVKATLTILVPTCDFYPCNGTQVPVYVPTPGDLQVYVNGVPVSFQ